MEFTTDRAKIANWAPLLMEGRADMPVAATKMDSGTDVNFGEIARKLIHWMSEQKGCGVATGHRVVDLKRTSDGWNLVIKDLNTQRKFTNRAKFVFVGAGGGSLPSFRNPKSPKVEALAAFLSAANGSFAIIRRSSPGIKPKSMDKRSMPPRPWPFPTWTHALSMARNRSSLVRSRLDNEVLASPR